MKPNKTETTSKMGKMMKTLHDQQPATEQEDTTHNTSAGESQSTSNNTGTEYSMHSGPTDIDTDVEWHFMNGKLIFNSV